MSQSEIPSDNKGPSLSHVESAYRSVRIELYSSTAKHFFDRRFDYVQFRLNYLLVVCPGRRRGRRIRSNNKHIREKLNESEEFLNDALIEAKDKLKISGVSEPVWDCSKRQVMNIKVFTPCANRFLGLIVKYDQMVLSLQMMRLRELISTQEMAKAIAQVKSAVQLVDYLILELYDRLVELNKRRMRAKS